MTNAANSVPEITLTLTTTNNGQSAAHITTLANGNFLAVWQVDAASGDPYGEASQFVGRVFTPGGVQVGPDRQIGAGTHALEDAYTGAGQYDVVGLANGGYAFVYTKHMTTASGLSTSGAGPVTGVFAQRYDSAGNAVGGEITVLPALDITYATPSGGVTFASVENHPHAYATTDGGFAVAAREEFPLDAVGFYQESAGLAEVNSGGGVVFSHFDAAGARNGLNYYANQDFQSYAVAINANHVGALGIRQWAQGNNDLFLRQEQNGSFLGIQDITAYTAGLGSQSSEVDPAIAALPNGNFIVSYTNDSAVSPTGPRSVEAQIIGPTGTVVKPHFLVPTETPVGEFSSAVGVFPNGNFVVVWETANTHTSGANFVHGQVFDESGNKINGEFEVNDNFFGARPFVTVIDSNTFAVAEDRYGGTSSALHILQVNPTPVTVQRALALYASYPFMSGVNVIDSTANVASGLDGLQAMQSHGALASIALTDSGTMSLTANQLMADAATLGLIATPYSLNVDAQGGSLSNYYLPGNVSNFTLSNESSALVSGNSQFDTINVGHGNDTVFGGAGGSYIIGNGGNDVLIGGAVSNTIYALGGNDYLQGGSGSASDVLVATGAGNDTFYGGSGDNYIVGGTGRNTIVGGPNGLESLYSSGTNDSSGTADYMVGGGTSCVLSEQGSGNDTLFGGLNSNNYIVGSNGNDLLVGGGLSDYVFAGNGNTTLYGGNGTDYLYTGSGTDFIWTDNVGQPQSTDYIYETGGSGTNTIADFTAGDVANHDVLVLSGTNLHSFADVQAHATQGANSPYTVISASATDQIYLYNVQPFQLTANDFLFT